MKLVFTNFLFYLHFIFCTPHLTYQKEQKPQVKTFSGDSFLGRPTCVILASGYEEQFSNNLE